MHVILLHRKSQSVYIATATKTWDMGTYLHPSQTTSAMHFTGNHWAVVLQVQCQSPHLLVKEALQADLSHARNGTGVATEPFQAPSAAQHSMWSSHLQAVWYSKRPGLCV